MKRIMSEELARAFRNPRFLIVAALALACFVIGNYRLLGGLGLLQGAASSDELLHPVNRMMLNLTYGEFAFLAALLATLPFADSFLTDRDQGFLRLIIQRTPYRRYLAAKIIAVALAGGVSLLLGVLVIFLAGLSTPTDWGAMDFYSTNYSKPDAPYGPFGWLYTLHPLSYLLYLLASAFGFGAVYALLGLAVSTVISNRYVVLAAPLVFVQVFGFLESRSLRLTEVFNPLYGLLPFDAYEGFLPAGQLAQFGLVLGVSLLCVLILARKARVTL